MIIPPLPQTLVPVMAFIAWFATNWLYHSPLKLWQNALIALLVPIFVAVLWAMGSGGFTRDLWGDIGLIVVLCYCAMAMPQLETWRQWFQDTFKSPFAWWSTPIVVDAAPQPAIRRASLPSSRVSRIPFDSSFHPMPPVLPTGPMPTVQSPHATAPMQPVTPEPATPVEESPAQS